MKKTYINPSMEIVKIKAQQILAGSLEMGSGDKNPVNADTRFMDFDFDED